MSLPVPNLDDRSFADLVAGARERIQQLAPEWTDLSVHDPGVTIIEAFAYLTDTLMYRLNRVPDKLYAVYLNLLGTSLYPPSTAETMLEFSRASAAGTTTAREIRIPRGTQVSCPPGVPGQPQPVFTTTAAATLESGMTSVLVPAADVTLYDAVLIGTGTGRPGQSLVIPNAPIVSGAGLAVAVEVPAGTRLSSGEAVLVDGKRFRYCQEVEAFADARPGEVPVRIDRSAGVAMFAWWDEESTGRTDQSQVPAPGAEVRAWFRSGGGAGGNVGAGQLTVLRSPVPGAKVTNPEPATGGRDGESLENALRRAPQDFQARDRAVTVRDYEVLARRHGGVGRARAFTRKDLWEFAKPGEVEIVLVPFVPGTRTAAHQPLRAAELAAQSRDEVRLEVEKYLRRRSTVGADPVVRWGLYKQVVVDARIVVRPDEDAEAVKVRIVGRLSEGISPLSPDSSSYGSGFGKPLRVSNLYRAMEEAEPGVQYVDRVRLEVDKVPDTDTMSLVQAEGQDSTWFVAQDGMLFRTTNAADGWEACAEFGDTSEGGTDEETVRAIAPFRSPAPGRAGPERHPGMVAVSTVAGNGSRIYISEDLGESWRKAAELGFVVADLCWVDRQGEPLLLLAGERGLYELPVSRGAIPVQNVVDTSQPDRGFYAVDALVDVRGRTGVVVAAEASAGVWLSPDAGTAGSFKQVKAAGEDIRCMTVQYDGGASYVWLGRAVPEGTGTGCLRLKIDELGRTDFDESFMNAWEQFSAGWTGGSCWGVHVMGSAAYAATQSGGVLRLQLGQASAQWSVPDVNCNLPLRDRTRFEPVRGVSGAVLPDGGAVVLAAGPRGIYRSRDDALTWESCTRRIVDDVVTLPDTWLFCSGDHRIEVVHGNG
ncbi:putative baseplate assembly protein [Arthrobacter sp. cf158]|uniref:baseplate J/gp47 family protein n=1 Tax=Arthrobacter sp. cf158 TaxID=1761744 RepID=UPI000894C8C4|nr:baseplate J/gp47 family protein [Arthrobacter sp. cf158]SDW70415.1 putative baseplate assembly protein [Arthrobacter sp. cf158]